jgi:ribosomal protein L25 (general stress protein Ctc)
MRKDQGKGASRRLRHQEQVPAIVYGAGKELSAITLNVHEIGHLLMLVTISLFISIRRKSTWVTRFLAG